MLAGELERDARDLGRRVRFELLLASVRRDIVAMRVAIAVRRWRQSWALALHGLLARAFNPDQPRVPAGNPDGGQWSSVPGSVGIGSDVVADDGFAERTDIAADGHHFVPRALFENENLSREARRVFEDAKTGRLHGGPHYFDGPYRAYNMAVAERYNDFLRERGLRSEELTPSQARQFADSIRNSTDPRIRDFNVYIYRREVWYWVRRLRLRE